MAVPVRRNCSGDVNQVHDPPAQNIPKLVRVLWQHQLGHFRA
jgi:hypothetical protein